MACSPSMRPRRVSWSAVDDVPYRDGVVGETGADLAPVPLDQDGHGHHQGAAGAVEYAPGGLDDQLPATAANVGRCPSPAARA
jgi:hypothetical protein